MKPQKRRPNAHHLHFMVDDELRELLEEHARRLDDSGPDRRPNVSAAVRDLLRGALGLTTAPSQVAPPRMRATRPKPRPIAYDRPSDAPVHPSEPRLATLYDQLNTKYFGGALPTLPVLVGLPADADGHEDLNGLTRMEWFAGDVEPRIAAIYLSLWNFETGPRAHDDPGRWQSIENTLLHEMVHAQVNLRTIRRNLPREPGGHGRRFTAACNKISRATGWGDVLPNDKCDDLDLNRASEWPACVREGDNDA